MEFYTSGDVVNIIKYMKLEFDFKRYKDFKEELKLQYNSLNNKNINLTRLVLLTGKVYSKFMSNHEEDLEKKLMERFIEIMYSDPCFFIDLNKIIKPRRVIILSTMN